MEFGRTYDKNVLENIQWSLPALDSDEEFHQLERIKRAAQKSEASPLLLIGTPIWGDPKWVGNLYPPKTKSADFLREYAKSFSTVEVNSSFYAIPSEDTRNKWIESVPPSFKFCPKFPQSISKPLAHALNTTELNAFAEWARGFEDHLGVCFLQLPPDVSLHHLPRLEELFKRIPKHLKAVVEFRHESFFHDRRLKTEIIDMLARSYLGTVSCDTSMHRELAHASLSSLRVLVRFASNDGHASDFERLNQWADRIETWFRSGMKEIYFITHAMEALPEIELAKYFIERINKKLGSLYSIPVPNFHHELQTKLL